MHDNSILGCKIFVGPGKLKLVMLGAVGGCPTRGRQGSPRGLQYFEVVWDGEIDISRNFQLPRCPGHRDINKCHVL